MKSLRNVLLVFLAVLCEPAGAAPAAPTFTGTFYRGTGDAAYLQLLETARRMFSPDPVFQNITMLYAPAWNGFVEGPTWGAWWVQNSYGTTYCALPFYTEPLVTFLQNAQDCWFDRMGDGTKTWTWNGAHGIVPDGQLCDCANAEMAIYKQGDGRVAIHDWGLEFTAAGLLMQAELLLVRRDPAATGRYLPLLERCADFLETRRDPKNNLFLAGPAANLLAPSYAGCKRPDGTYGKAYLAGLSITYVAALDRLVEVQKLAGNDAKARLYARRRDLARRGLPLLQTAGGCFVKSIDPGGTKHGVYGAPRHGYFEASPNHDAVCFDVVDDATAQRICAKMAAIPGLRPYDFTIANYPSLDDMYTAPEGLWSFGTWVNGGHWSTCEARMIMAYYRVGDFVRARRSMERLLTFARRFRMDNPLVRFGSAVYQPGEAINLCYDSFGPPAALIRGLFRYRYGADGLTLVPRIPPGMTYLEQRFPVHFGTKRLYLACAGTGPVTAVSVNNRPWKRFDESSVFLAYGDLPERAAVQILRGGAAPRSFLPPPQAGRRLPPPPSPQDAVLMRNGFPAMTANDLPLRIGADSNGGSRFLGDIDRVRIFKRALTPSEVAALARRQPGKLAADPALLADWAFEDKGEKGLFGSAAGAGLTARAVGEVTRLDAPGGKAVHLAGRGYLEVADDPRLDLTEAVTLAAWIRPQAMPAAGGRIVDKTAVGTSTGYLLDTFPATALRAITEAATVGWKGKLPVGRWVHVAAAVTPAGRVSLYIDGKGVARTEGAGGSAVWAPLVERTSRLRSFYERLVAAGWGESYEAAHARLAVRCLAACCARRRLAEAGSLPELPARSRIAADRSYLTATARLCEGLERVLGGYRDSSDARKKKIYGLWAREKPPAPQ